MIDKNINLSVYKYEKYIFDQPFFFFQAKKKFVVKSKFCAGTRFSRALDNSKFDGNTILLKCEDSKYVYISGLEIFEFRTDDKILDYISLMGKCMTPHSFVVREKLIYFKLTHYKFIENDKIEEGTLLNLSNNSFDPYDYHISKNGLDCFKK